MENNFKAPEKSQVKKVGNWNIGRIFWGLLLVLIGILLIINNFGLAIVNWSGMLSLWPLFIIAAGLSVLSVNNLFWKIITIILAIASLFVITFVAIGDYHFVNLQDKQINIDKDGFHIIIN